MKGIHRIRVENKRVRYEFELRRNLTVLRGDSATGKTTLIEMIQEHINNGDDSSVQLVCDKACYVLDGVTWRGQLAEMRDSIVFIDEGNPFVFSDEFSEVIQKTDNYYVIVSREGLPNLPYSVTEIYGIRSGGKYGGLRQQYNEFYRIYGNIPASQEITPQEIITEDSRAGYQFFCDIGSKNGIDCFSAGGKSNILRTVREKGTEKEVLIVADGAAFGPEMDRSMMFLQGHKNVHLYVPESFEWLILSANVLDDLEIRRILNDPSAYIESSEYYSWERFFTKVLTERTHGTWLQYSKDRLNHAYLQSTVQDAIMKEIHMIRFEDRKLCI